MRVTWLFVSIALLATAFLPLMSGCNRSYADRVVSVGPDQLTVAEGPNGLRTTHEVARNVEIAIDGKPAKLDDIQPGDRVRVTTEVQGDQEIAVKIDAERAEKAMPAEGPDELEPPAAPPALSPMPASPHEPVAPQPDRPAVPDTPENQTKGQADKSAQPGGDQPKPPASEQPSAPRPEETAKTMFHGKIDLVGSDLLRVNADADMTHLAAMMSFTVTKDTEILIAGAPATLEDLSEGMAVTVVATKQAGQAIAERIEADPMPV